ncbi:MAG: prepilin-type N-terminal cleavage/methylation domain-containing protein [bacterium]
MSKLQRRRGFTLIELLIVIVVIAILALIVIPKLMGASRKAKDSTLRANLQILRSAVETFQSDCGGYPNVLSDLTVTTAPTQVYIAGVLTNLPTGSYKGPYLNAQGGIAGGSIPRNPYSTSGTTSAHWGLDNSGKVTIGTDGPTGTDASGEAYSSY